LTTLIFIGKMPNMFSKGGIMFKNRLLYIQKKAFLKIKAIQQKNLPLWKTTKKKKSTNFLP